MRLIINNILSEQDKDVLNKGLTQSIIDVFDIENLEKLHSTLSARDKHFFECLAWLIQNKRIEVKIIAPQNEDGIAHTKCGVFADGVNKVAFDGSCNFTFKALVANCESITASCSWDAETEVAKIDDIEEDFNKTFNGKDDSVTYLEANDVICRVSEQFKTKEIEELLVDERNLIDNVPTTNIPMSVRLALQKAKDRVNRVIESIKAKEEIAKEEQLLPHFPYKEGPRDYQKEAFENWKNNKQKGLFAMATGTGKTITSLNCLYEIYKSKSYYKAIILVPTISLVEQWEHECRKFNFSNIIKVFSQNHNWSNEVNNIKTLEKYKLNDGKASYIIISTYASFAREKVFKELNSFPKNQLLLIADEAHNMGSGQIRNRLNDIIYLRRIGLSATPERQFDDSGTQKLYSFFGAETQFTYEYSMEDAIANGVLCKYEYYPHVVNLTNEEMAEYMEISRKLAKFYGVKTAEAEDIVKRMLLARKRILHKAENKKEAFKQIIENRFAEKGHLKYTLVYAPEGSKNDEDEDVFDTTEEINDDELTSNLISQFTSIVRDVSPMTTVKQFTSSTGDREEILAQFASGEIQVLTSMKCLDEGVDVPRSELAIFCASTGNPRQFIQRRGRILRQCKGKDHAVIHDLVVLPIIEPSIPENYNVERSLVEGELRRVSNFARLSENPTDAYNELEKVLNHYNLSIYNY